MKDYASCIEYLHSLGLPVEICERICNRFKSKDDMEGLVDLMLLYDALVDNDVD